MTDLASSFEDAWARFQARDSLRLVGDTLEWEWSRGRAQFLAFLVRIDDAAVRGRLSRLAERLAGIAGVEPYPDWYWHVTVKGVGFQVIKRTQPDDVLREEVPRIASSARALLTGHPAFEAQLGLVNGFAEVVFVEVWDQDRFADLNVAVREAPEVPRVAIDQAPFLPHISIARFTSNEGLAEVKETLAALRAEGPGPTFTVGRVEFIKAWLSEETPELDTLATYPLKEPAVSGYRAVVFDMDGVLVDTEPAFFDAANAILAEEGQRIEWDRYKVLLGTSVEVTWQSLIDMLGLQGDLHAYLRRFGIVLRDELAKPRPPLPGVVALLDELTRRQVPVALATSSWRPWAEIVLASCGLSERFPQAATGDEIEHEKPAPDIYLKAAGMLGIEPERCVAIEDTAPGVASAKAAGMHAIQVRASSTALPPLAAADQVIDSLEQFPLELLDLP